LLVTLFTFIRDTPCCDTLLRRSPPTLDSLLRQLEGAPAFPAFRAVGKDARCQCLLEPQLELVFGDHLGVQTEGVSRTVGPLRHPISANHIYHKSWTVSVRFALHSLHSQRSENLLLVKLTYRLLHLVYSSKNVLLVPFHY
jgi:hypothetical protein